MHALLIRSSHDMPMPRAALWGSYTALVEDGRGRGTRGEFWIRIFYFKICDFELYFFWTSITSCGQMTQNKVVDSKRPRILFQFKHFFKKKNWIIFIPQICIRRLTEVDTKEIYWSIGHRWLYGIMIKEATQWCMLAGELISREIEAVVRLQILTNISDEVSKREKQRPAQYIYKGLL